MSHLRPNQFAPLSPARNSTALMKGDMVDEEGSAVLPVEDLTVFNDAHPRPAGAVSGDDAVMNLLKW